MARSVRRLPGVQFESRPPPLAEVLPRMDVAAFVGFAAAGPIDVPVPLSDARSFADVFGDDAALAWDGDQGETRNANLGPAVRAFFRNGGSRCWVVRVARTPWPGDAPGTRYARANRFALPGLARLRAGALLPAFVAARSEGSWSDGVTVGAAIQLQPVLATDAQVDGVAVASVKLGAPDTVEVGDLLRLTWGLDDSPPSAVSLLAAVEEIGPDRVLLAAGQIWLLPAPADLGGTWSASYFQRDETAQALPALAQPPSLDADGTASLLFAAPAPLRPAQTVVLSRGDDRLWLTVLDTRTESHASPPALATGVTARWARPWIPPVQGPPQLPVDPSGSFVGERVRVAVLASRAGGLPAQLGGLGLSPGHPRYLGALPTDGRLFDSGDDLLSDDERALQDRIRALFGDGVDLRSHHADFWQSVANPRFPLAVDTGRTDLFVPFALPIVADVFVGASPVDGEPLERDGLAQLEPVLFLDPALADETVLSLPEQAGFIRWQSPQPRRLRGIHALFDVDEATLAAVPDAVQRAWEAEDAPATREIDTPVLTASPDASGIWHLSWTSVAPDVSYALESAGTPDFGRPRPIDLKDATVRSFDVPADVASGTWYRVRAFVRVPSGEILGSFWSDPAQVIVPPPDFADCAPGTLGVPRASLASPPDASGSYQLSWTAVDGAIDYELEESSALDFSDATLVFAGQATDAFIYGRAAGKYHYRVRAKGSLATTSAAIEGLQAARLDVTAVATPAHVVAARYAGTSGEEVVFDGEAFTARFLAGSARTLLSNGFRYSLARDLAWPGAPSFRAWDPGATGGYSNGVAVTVPQAVRRVLSGADTYDPGLVLVPVQAALLRLCAARGDLLAVLALPEHYRENDSVRHPDLLRSRTPEETPWSFGALYHPWVLCEGDAGILRCSPDGAICGAVAGRAVARGAWIAPANQPLVNVLGLTPPIARAQWGRLMDAHVNLLLDEPRGFLVLSADTLAEDPDLVPLNVRRLLSLLRRAALRIGPTFVFEPNGDVFRRSVEREFGDLLDGLQRRGAFAGATPDQSYQVVVDDSSSSLDLGRLVVELKVAPSLPLEFLTVRLLQSGTGALTTEGA
jgi:hypothetical protein